MADEFGFRNATQNSDSLRWRLMQFPTGRQMAMDGTLVYGIYPTVAALPMTAPNGTHATVTDDVTIKDYVFTRALGWTAV